jgi:hypothetical protein
MLLIFNGLNKISAKFDIVLGDSKQLGTQDLSLRLVRYMSLTCLQIPFKYHQIPLQDTYSPHGLGATQHFCFPPVFKAFLREMFDLELQARYILCALQRKTGCAKIRDKLVMKANNSLFH